MHPSLIESLYASSNHTEDHATEPTTAPKIMVVGKKQAKGASPFQDILIHTAAEPSKLAGIKVENCVGFAQIPVGIAGPLKIQGENQKGTVHAPLATIEATLVASCSRGCKAFMLSSGGIHAAALSENMSRAPAFRFKTTQDAVAFYKLLPSLEPTFRKSAALTSRFVRLRFITGHIIGTSVHVKFHYTCGDACGQNGTTIATHRACQDFLASPAGADAHVVGYQLEGQMASDKKASWVNVVQGRGVEVVVWSVITDDVAKKVLGVSTLQLERAMSTGQQGGIRAGMFGNNVNTANVIAAMFIACGQDAASVFEAGFTQLTHSYNPDTKDLDISLYIPSLPVGTVGGGTGLATQKECLELLNCYGAGKKWALAETIAAFALALDISTMAAVSNDTFAQSHQRLARANL